MSADHAAEATASKGRRALLVVAAAALIGNAASRVAAVVAPGSSVEISGLQLANQSAQSSGPPFPTVLNSVQVFMGGRPLPLRSVRSDQVTAQVPFDLPINSAQQLVIKRGSDLSVPQDVVVAAADPAVYTQDGSGTGAGLITDAAYRLITSDNPPTEGR